MSNDSAIDVMHSKDNKDNKDNGTINNMIDSIPDSNNPDKSKENTNTPSELVRPKRSNIKVILIILVAVAAGAGGLWYFSNNSENPFGKPQASDTVTTPPIAAFNKTSPNPCYKDPVIKLTNKSKSPVANPCSTGLSEFNNTGHPLNKSQDTATELKMDDKINSQLVAHKKQINVLTTIVAGHDDAIRKLKAEEYSLAKKVAALKREASRAKIRAAANRKVYKKAVRKIRSSTKNKSKASNHYSKKTAKRTGIHSKQSNLPIYTLTGIVNGRAWVELKDGTIKVLKKGMTIPVYGRIIKVSAMDGIMTQQGKLKVNIPK